MEMLKTIFELPAKVIPLIGSKKNAFGLIVLVLIMYLGLTTIGALEDPAQKIELAKWMILGFAITALGVAVGQGIADHGKEAVKEQTKANAANLPTSGGQTS